MAIEEDNRDPMEIAEERIAEAKRTGARFVALDLSELGLNTVPK